MLNLGEGENFKLELSAGLKNLGFEKSGFHIKLQNCFTVLN